VSTNAYTTAAIHPGSARRGSAPSRPLGIAALCALALAVIWVVAQLVPAAHLRDALTLRDFTLLSRPHVDSASNFLIHLLKPTLFILWGVALVTVSLARERPRVALAVVGVMSLAPLTSETLKPLLAHPHAQVGAVHVNPASWPSGHSTAAMALVLSAVLVSPARLRPMVAALGGAFAAAVGVALLILAWHMPSDVLGGYLVAALWTALAVAALRAAERRWPSKHSVAAG
jgi:membrane-associated phospholipid phosphatase